MVVINLFIKLSIPIFWGSILVISYLAFMPVSNKIIDISFGDKLNHFGAFFVLYFVGYFRYGKLNNYKFISGLIFYGIFIETVQYFLPFREFSLLDVLADSFGVLISYLILNLLSKKNISNI